MSSESGVIVIGAGAAGLSAAKELCDLGLSCSVIDGSHRIGGRAYSEEIAPGVWFDLGCAWLVGGASNPFVAIADDLGITLGKDKNDWFKIENVRFQRNGEPLNDDQRAALLGYYDNSLNHAGITLRGEKSADFGHVAIGLSLSVRHADEHRRERPIALWQVDIACHPSGVTHGVDGKF